MNRLVLFRVLLVVSIVWEAISFVVFLIMALMAPQIGTYIQSHPQMVPSEWAVLWERMATLPRLFYASMALFQVLSVVGCFLMWYLRRSGYHFYAIAQLLMLAVPPLFLGKGYLGLGDIMFTALYLFIYYSLLKGLAAEKAEASQDGDNNITSL